MTLSELLTINLAWSIVMLCAFTVLYVGGPNSARETLILLSVAYVAVATVARRHKRWAVATSVVVAALVTLRWAPMVGYNWWMFFGGHELYLDSPGTIIIVAIYSLLLALPATGLLVGYVANGRALLTLVAK